MQLSLECGRRVKSDDAPRPVWHSWQRWQRVICNLTAALSRMRFESPPLRQVLQWFKDVVSPWWGICWNAGLPTLEQLQGAQSRHAGRLHQHTAGAKKERRTHSAIKKQSAPRKTRCCGEACVLIALSLVAILATLGAPIAMFDGVSPNSLAPVRNDPKNRGFQEARRFATGGYALPRRPSHRNDKGHRGVVAVWTG